MYSASAVAQAEWEALRRAKARWDDDKAAFKRLDDDLASDPEDWGAANRALRTAELMLADAAACYVEARLGR